MDQVQHLNAKVENVSHMPPEEECVLEPIPQKNTKNIGSLDAGSTFDSTNNKLSLTNMVVARTPIASRTNEGQRKIKNCGETPG